MGAMKCVDCGKDFDIDIPQHETINSKTVSMVIFAHPGVPCCPYCGTAYQFEVAGFKQAVFGFKKIELPKGNKIVDASSMSLDLSMLKNKH